LGVQGGEENAVNVVREGIEEEGLGGGR